jgi:hypothetical protein
MPNLFQHWLTAVTVSNPNKHVLSKSKVVQCGLSYIRFTSKLHTLKFSCHCLSRIWFRSHYAANLQSLCSTTKKYHAAIIEAKLSFYASKINSNISSSRQLWTSVDKSHYCKCPDTLPTVHNHSHLPDLFPSIFSHPTFMNIVLIFSVALVTLL